MQVEKSVDTHDVAEVTVRSKGRVTLPKDVRDRHDLDEGDRVEVVVVGRVDE